MKEPLRHHTGTPKRRLMNITAADTTEEWLDEDVLDFEGADYILEPRQRPFFGAYIGESL